MAETQPHSPQPIPAPYGTILPCYTKAYPLIHIKALVCRHEDAAELQSISPNLIPIIGELSELSLLRSTAASAGFVIHAGGENVPAVTAVLWVVSQTTARSQAPNPLSHLIALIGPCSVLDFAKTITGNLDFNSQPCSDVADAHAILDLPPDRINADFGWLNRLEAKGDGLEGLHGGAG